MSPYRVESMPRPVGFWREIVPRGVGPVTSTRRLVYGDRRPVRAR